MCVCVCGGGGVEKDFKGKNSKEKGEREYCNSEKDEEFF